MLFQFHIIGDTGQINDPMRVNCARGLNFIVSEANFGIRVCSYFSFKNSFFSDNLGSICAKFVPFSHRKLSLTGRLFAYYSRPGNK